RFYPKRLTYVRLTMYTHFTFTLMAHCTSGAIRGSVSCSRMLRQGIELATFCLINDFFTSCTTVALYVALYVCLACVFLTQPWAAVVADHPGEDGVLGQVIHAAVGQVVQVQHVLVVGDVAPLPLQHVALCCVLCHVVLYGTHTHTHTHTHTISLSHTHIHTHT